MSTEIPSHERVEPGSCQLPPLPREDFPPSATSTSIDAERVASDLIELVNESLLKKDYEALSRLFVHSGFWRDHLALTWDYRTLKGPEKIAKFLEENGGRLGRFALDKSSAFKSPHVAGLDGLDDSKGIQFFTTFETDVGKGQGVVRLAEVDDTWKIFLFFTSLRELKGFEEPLGPRRPKGVQHGMQEGRKNWKERRDADIAYEDKEPVVVVLGAGQAGLTVAARLKMQGIDALVVDSEDRVGDNWRRRYRGLVLHDPAYYNHLPYLNFPEWWPVFTPKDKLAEFFEAYVKLLELNVWTRTTLTSATWDDTKRNWTVHLDRRREDGSTESRTFHPRHVIQATGHSGKKNLPTIKGMESFEGTRICHSSEHPGASPNSQGKKAVVVGCCNSGHDIAQDFYEKGYDVTIIQRSSTCVVSSYSITDIGLKGLYDEGSPPPDDGDLWLFGLPSEVHKSQQIKVTKMQNEHDKALLDGLEKAGFKVDMGLQETGLYYKYFQRGGGYYIDVGASQLIIDGKVKIKQGQQIDEVLPHGLRFADGSELGADEIVFATGYQNMRTETRAIFGDAVADRVSNVWGLDEEGEFRAMWRRSGHPGFWFMGGNLALCRYFSRLLALQIKALEEGITS